MENAMRIYGAGGAGINVASRFLGAQQAGLARPIVSLVDTSRSNIAQSVPDECCYILKDLDGSGKVRAENHEQIANEIKSILLAHKPGDFNVVVFSAAGGSGSVIGPLIVSELLERGHPIVCVVVGSDESTITATNTLKTLKTLEAIAQQRQAPVVMTYDHNLRGQPRSAQDDSMNYIIACLALLSSRTIAELDSKDVANFLRFDRTTSVSARLAVLDIVKNSSDLGNNDVISVASILESPNEPGITVVPEYHCAGYTKLPMEGVRSLHYAISITPVTRIASMLNETLRGLDEVRQSRVATATIIGKDDKVQNTGLIL